MIAENFPLSDRDQMLIEASPTVVDACLKSSVLHSSVLSL